MDPNHPFYGLTPEERGAFIRAKALVPIGDERDRRISQEADRRAPWGPRSNTVAFVWDADKTAMPGYQQETFFPSLRARQLAGGMDEDRAANIDKFLRRVQVQQAAERAHPHRHHGTEPTYFGIMLALSKEKSWNITADDMLVLGEELKFADKFLRLNERTKRLGSLLGLNVEIHIASSGWRRYMLGALNQTILLGGRPQRLIDDIWAIEFSSKNGPDDEPIRRSPMVVSAPEKILVLQQLKEGANVYLERDNAFMPESDYRIPTRSITSFGDGASDKGMWMNSGAAYGVWYEGNEPQRELMQALAGAGLIEAAVKADFSEYGPIEAITFGRLLELADDIAFARNDLTIDVAPQQVFDLGGHPGELRTRDLGPDAMGILRSRAFQNQIGTGRRALDVVSVLRYVQQERIVAALPLDQAEGVRKDHLPETLTLLLPRSVKNDGAVLRMLARFKGDADVWADQQYRLPSRVGESATYTSDVYGTIEIVRTALTPGQMKATSVTVDTMGMLRVQGIAPEALTAPTRSANSGLSL